MSLIPEIQKLWHLPFQVTDLQSTVSGKTRILGSQDFTLEFQLC